jgi:hypothetical protein
MTKRIRSGHQTTLILGVKGWLFALKDELASLANSRKRPVFSRTICPPSTISKAARLLINEVINPSCGVEAADCACVKRYT